MDCGVAMNVRKAQPEDIGTLIEMLLLMQEESPVYSVYTPAYQKAYRSLLVLMLNPDALILMLDDGSGMFIAKVEQSLWFEESVAWEEILFVKKELRGTSRAVAMIKEYEKWAKEKGAVEARLVLSTEVSVEKTFDFYERMGFKPVGGFFSKEVV